MGAFIAKQPNGLYCRFSTVVDTITHFDMTDEEHVEMCAEEAREKAREIEADVCSSMGAMLEDYKNEILDAIGKAKNTEPSRTIHNSGISEDALLKIVAVAQNPELIKDMPYERD